MRYLFVLLAVGGCAVIDDASVEAGERIVGRVVGVSDGDTITVLDGRDRIRVRLEGIDAPERGQAYGAKARQALSRLLDGRTVSVESSGHDRYGRVLGTVRLGVSDRSRLRVPDSEVRVRTVNEWLVASGWAWQYRKYNQDARLSAMEAAARKSGAGLWADRDATPPWEFRASRRNRKSVKRETVKRTPAPEQSRRAQPAGQDKRPRAESPTDNSSKTKPAEQERGQGYWLTNSSGVRHNSSCRWYRRSRGRECGPKEGRACKICGG